MPTLGIRQCYNAKILSICGFVRRGRKSTITELVNKDKSNQGIE